MELNPKIFQRLPLSLENNISEKYCCEYSINGIDDQEIFKTVKELFVFVNSNISNFEIKRIYKIVTTTNYLLTNLKTLTDIANNEQD